MAYLGIMPVQWFSSCGNRTLVQLRNVTLPLQDVSEASTVPLQGISEAWNFQRAGRDAACVNRYIKEL